MRGLNLKKFFCDKWKFPNAIAAVDEKHGLIQAPPHSGSNYFCYKKHFSLVLLALVDADKKIHSGRCRCFWQEL